MSTLIDLDCLTQLAPGGKVEGGQGGGQKRYREVMEVFKGGEEAISQVTDGKWRQ